MAQCNSWWFRLVAAVGGSILGWSASTATEPTAANSDPRHAEKPAAAPADPAAASDVSAAPARRSQDLTDLKQLHERLWIDQKNKWVVLDGEVVLRKGPPLEMFACLAGTKEHESIVAVETKAYMVHAALLAVGAKPGTTVRFEPKYQPATGPEIEIVLLWADKDGKRRRARAQDWIRDINTRQAMSHPFVFAGSGYWKDETSGRRHYLAEGGELICVSNFPSAMIDLPVESSQSNTDLLFEAFTEHIPPEGTRVRLVLMPKLGKAESGKSQPNKSQPGKTDSGSTELGTSDAGHQR